MPDAQTSTSTGTPPGVARHPAATRLLNKVPAITATFWLIKVLSTTIGETFADYLSVQVGLGPLVTDGAMVTLLVIALVAQLRTRRLAPWLYWLTVVLVSIVGTQITDFFTDVLGVSLYVSTAVFAASSLWSSPCGGVRSGPSRSPRSTRLGASASTGARSSRPSRSAPLVATSPPRRSRSDSATVP